MKARIFKAVAFVSALIISSSFAFAQNYEGPTKNTRYSGYEDGSANKVKRSVFHTGFDSQFSIAGYYSFPFMSDASDWSKYGARAEFGYLTQGRFGFYTGIAYQYGGCKIENRVISAKINSHNLLLPEQFSVRFAPGNVPIQLRVGPFIGFNLATKVGGGENIPDRDIFEWGFQFNAQVAFFTIGYTLPVGNNTGLDGFSRTYLGNSLLSLGLVFDF